MRVLGVDPGLTRCGIGIVDAQGHKLQFVAAGVIRTDAAKLVELRLLGIEQGIAEWLDEFQPDAVAVERVFAQHNLQTVMGTAQAAGIVITASAKRGIPVSWHTPSEIKAAVTGNGRADKPQVQFMVQRILHLSETPKPADAADALALAITHIWRPTSADGVGQPIRSAEDRNAQACPPAAARSARRETPTEPRTSATQKWLEAEAAAKHKNPRSWQ